jgi:hypothetical protein
MHLVSTGSSREGHSHSDTMHVTVSHQDLSSFRGRGGLLVSSDNSVEKAMDENCEHAREMLL